MGHYCRTAAVAFRFVRLRLHGARRDHLPRVDAYARAEQFQIQRLRVRAVLRCNRWQWRTALRHRHLQRSDGQPRPRRLGQRPRGLGMAERRVLAYAGGHAALRHDRDTHAQGSDAGRRRADRSGSPERRHVCRGGSRSGVQRRDDRPQVGDADSVAGPMVESGHRRDRHDGRDGAGQRHLHRRRIRCGHLGHRGRAAVRVAGGERRRADCRARSGHPEHERLREGRRHVPRVDGRRRGARAARRPPQRRHRIHVASVDRGCDQLHRRRHSSDAGMAEADAERHDSNRIGFGQRHDLDADRLDQHRDVGHARGPRDHQPRYGAAQRLDLRQRRRRPSARRAVLYDAGSRRHRRQHDSGAGVDQPRRDQLRRPAGHLESARARRDGARHRELRAGGDGQRNHLLLADRRP